VSGRAAEAESWHILTMLGRAPGFNALADTLAELVEEGRPVVACTADLKYSNGLVRFEEKHPDRFVQFGISEQNMVTAAAGMATVGVRPYVATFASFLALLCCEQVRTDIAYPNLPVRLIGHHAGITLGFYGTSHHATEDLAIMRSIANLSVVAPADAASLAAAIRATADLDGPIYFRIGRGREPEVYAEGMHFELGRAIVHSAGSDLTIIATGSCLHPALRAAETLRDSGYDVGVIDMHTVKPLDVEAVVAAATRSGMILTVEEHTVVGGLGGAVSEVLAEAGAATRIHRHGIQDDYAPIGPPTDLYRHLRLDAEGITGVAAELLRDASSA
jgi:transketolase